MSKMRLLLGFFLMAGAPILSGLEKLDSKYWVQYGNPEGKVEAVEYFSLSCPKCIAFFRDEFPRIQKDYIDTGAISWIFHPDPADLSTLQAMVCLETLSPKERPLFFEMLMEHCASLKDSGKRCRLMQAAMEAFEKPLPDLERIDFLETTEAFGAAFQFLTQEGALQLIPSVEINGTLYKEYPSAEFIGERIADQRRLS